VLAFGRLACVRDGRALVITPTGRYDLAETFDVLLAEHGATARHRLMACPA